MKTNYTDEVRIKIVKMHLEQGRTIKSLADEFGVSVSSVGRWVVRARNSEIVKNKFGGNRKTDINTVSASLVVNEDQ